jgi:hypothetical protein
LAAGEPGWPRKLESEGILSGQAGSALLGYVVEGKAAMRALELYDSAAARWWRENVPEMFSRTYRLGFPAEVCERIDPKIT